MKRKMKIFLEILIFLLVFSTIFLYINTLFARQWQKESNATAKMDEVLELPKKTLDVLFLGSSTVMAGVSPARLFDKTEITSYNLGNSRHNMFSRYHKFKQVLENHDPKLIIMDLTIVFSKSNPYSEDYMPYYQSGFNTMKNISSKKEYIKDLKNEYCSINELEYWFPIIKHHVNWDKFNHDNLEYNPKNGELGGILSKVIKPIEYTSNANKIEINKIEKKYLEKILTLAKEKDVEVLCITAPLGNFNKNRSDYLVKLSKEFGFKFIDFSKRDIINEIGLDHKSDFYNEGHLNVFGNRKFTDYLGNYLLDNYNDELKLNQSGEDKSKKDLWYKAIEKYNIYYNKLEEKRNK